MVIIQRTNILPIYLYLIGRTPSASPFQAKPHCHGITLLFLQLFFHPQIPLHRCHVVLPKFIHNFIFFILSRFPALQKKQADFTSFLPLFRRLARAGLVHVHHCTLAFKQDFFVGGTQQFIFRMSFLTNTNGALKSFKL